MRNYSGRLILLWMVLYLTALPGDRKEYNGWAFMLFKEKRITSVGSLQFCVCVHVHCIQLIATPMNCSLPGSSVPGVFQARILEWFAVSYSRGSY